ncbi:hypothetical protein PCAR4_1090076 [Paraburkholderia caribensis]|nr:hypothetical protein PCAR4_1090076 [Paraburkholderia caribensis]
MRITRFTHLHDSPLCQTVHCRPGGKLCVGPSTPHALLRTGNTRVPPRKSDNQYGATTYTQFATWAAHIMRRRLPLHGYSKRVRRSLRALATHANSGVAV